VSTSPCWLCDPSTSYLRLNGLFDVAKCSNHSSDSTTLNLNLKLTPLMDVVTEAPPRVRVRGCRWAESQLRCHRGDRSGEESKRKHRDRTSRRTGIPPGRPLRIRRRLSGKQPRPIRATGVKFRVRGKQPWWRLCRGLAYVPMMVPALRQPPPAPPAAPMLVTAPPPLALAAPSTPPSRRQQPVPASPPAVALDALSIALVQVGVANDEMLHVAREQASVRRAESCMRHAVMVRTRLVYKRSTNLSSRHCSIVLATSGLRVVVRARLYGRTPTTCPIQRPLPSCGQWGSSHSAFASSLTFLITCV
jgi:hypothetical protein